VVQVFVSVPSTRVATQIARALVEERLCACAQTLGPIRSHYRWKGKVESAREWLLLIKTRTSRLAKLEATIQRLHPYDVPEILALPIERGHAPYLDWLQKECG
jgi:periplasmic divalent cation tolerance protein